MCNLPQLGSKEGLRETYPMNNVCKSRQRNTFRLEMRNDPLILLSMNQTLRLQIIQILHKDLNIYSLGSPKFRRHQAGLPHGIGPQGTLFDDNDNAIPNFSMKFWVPTGGAKDVATLGTPFRCGCLGMWMKQDEMESQCIAEKSWHPLDLRH